MPLKNKIPDEDGLPPSKRKMASKDSDEYRAKRDRNNVAVKKSRERTRQKAKETMDRVNKLKQENEDLEMKVKVLSKELSLLKDLFLSHAGNVPDVKPNDAYFPIKTEPGALNSAGESDDSSSGVLGAGTQVDAVAAVQKDHKYFAAPLLVLGPQ